MGRDYNVKAGFRSWGSGSLPDSILSLEELEVDAGLEAG